MITGCHKAVVVGDFRVGTCELLIGIPALKQMKAQIDCDIGVMSLESTSRFRGGEGEPEQHNIELRGST